MPVEPVVAATWRFGLPACDAALASLAAGGRALDAAIAGAAVVEDEPTVTTVGYGAMPNAAGVVELDAGVMDGRTHGVGAVAGVVGIRPVAQLARCVMDRTPHAMLVGANARDFALAQGFAEENLLSPAAAARWDQWRREAGRAEGHDTIGVCVLDAYGDLAVACSTSGLAWKLPGRVGDSPIVGSGYYVDGEVGAAVATGNGDEIVRVCLSYRVVSAMERGVDPQEACEEALRYLLRKRPGSQGLGAAVIALRADGHIGTAATRDGFPPGERLWEVAVGRGAGPASVFEGPYIA